MEKQSSSFQSLINPLILDLLYKAITNLENGDKFYVQHGQDPTTQN